MIGLKMFYQVGGFLSRTHTAFTLALYGFAARRCQKYGLKPDLQCSHRRGPRKGTTGTGGGGSNEIAEPLQSQAVSN